MSHGTRLELSHQNGTNMRLIEQLLSQCGSWGCHSLQFCTDATPSQTQGTSSPPIQTSLMQCHQVRHTPTLPPITHTHVFDTHLFIHLCFHVSLPRIARSCCRNVSRKILKVVLLCSHSSTIPGCSDQPVCISGSTVACPLGDSSVCSFNILTTFEKLQ